MDDYRFRAMPLTLLVVGLLCHLANAQKTYLVSRTPSGRSGNGLSQAPQLSADGRFVVFHSRATDLVSDETSGFLEIFLFDRESSLVTLVSRAPDGGPANFFSRYPSINASGRFVTFSSRATNLVPGDETSEDFFWKDLWTGEIRIVSLPDDGNLDHDCRLGLGLPANLSSDGSLVLYSCLEQMTEGADRNGIEPFVRNMIEGTTERVALTNQGVEANGGSHLTHGPGLSFEGRLVVFSSQANNLVSSDQNNRSDVFLRDRLLGTTIRVSEGSMGEEGNDLSRGGVLSGGGRFVVFSSEADSLVDDDQNDRSDVFLKDLVTGELTRESLDSLGREADGVSWPVSISPDGRFILFSSLSTNLWPGAKGVSNHVYVRDRRYGHTTYISSPQTGGRESRNSYAAAMTPDGRWVTFSSTSGNLVPDDGNFAEDVFLHDRWGKAIAESYGTGWPGTNGEPQILPLDRPILGTRLAVVLKSSRSVPTEGLLLVGPYPSEVRSRWDGEILVQSKWQFPVTIPSAGTTVSLELPADAESNGLTWYVQLMVTDPGASRGVAFSAGARFRLGTP